MSRRARGLTAGVAALGVVGWALAAAPAPVSAHPLAGRVDSPLSLELYLAGVALAGQAVLADPGPVCPRRLLEQRGPRSFLTDDPAAVPNRLTAEIPCR